MDRFNGAQAAVRMLELNGVRHIFGLCGDTSLPFYDALCTMEHGMTHVLTRDEVNRLLEQPRGTAPAAPGGQLAHGRRLGAQHAGRRRRGRGVRLRLRDWCE